MYSTLTSALLLPTGTRFVPGFVPVPVPLGHEPFPIVLKIATSVSAYTADATVEYAETDVAIFSTIGNGSWPSGTGTGTKPGTNLVPVGSNNADVRVEYMASGLPPVGSGGG